MKQYSLSYLLSQCTDFTEQKTDIDQLCDEISINYLCKSSILFTPKYHCKLAGEGIKYSWGASKRVYRRKPLSEKKQSAHFKALVRSCVMNISIPMVRRFSAKSRGYMLTYAFKKKKEEDDNYEMDWNYETNEKIHKIYRGHRGANCINGKFIEEVMSESIGIVTIKTIKT